MKEFTIKVNSYLSADISGYYNCDYVGYQKSGNPDFINHLKNMPMKSSELDLVKDFIDMQYVGITKDTCQIDETKIVGKDIIPVDDIYTEGVFVAEDCIQTLLDLGAKSVILYVIAKTRD